jgi:hypothetical protein
MLATWKNRGTIFLAVCVKRLQLGRFIGWQFSLYRHRPLECGRFSQLGMSLLGESSSCLGDLPCPRHRDSFGTRKKKKVCRWKTLPEEL